MNYRVEGSKKDEQGIFKTIIRDYEVSNLDEAIKLAHLENIVGYRIYRTNKDDSLNSTKEKE